VEEQGMKDYDNLWGELPEPDDLRSPAQILAEQGAILGAATKNVLLGKVVELPRSDDETVRIQFDILAPALENYSYALCVVEYDPVVLYPVYLTSFVGPSRGPNVGPPRVKSCADESEFRAELQAVLSSDKTKKVISALLRESKGPVGAHSLG